MWWKKIGNESIEFFDAESHPNFKSEGPSLHHFCSTNFEKEVNYLKECWEKCMENKQQIPLPQLRIPDCDGNMVLTRNIINEEEADDGMNSGGDEGDIVMVEKVVVNCGDRVVSLGNDGDMALEVCFVKIKLMEIQLHVPVREIGKAMEMRMVYVLRVYKEM